MWRAWDLAADLCLAQLPKLLSDPNYEYQPSCVDQSFCHYTGSYAVVYRPFFAEQLTAFEVWLEHEPDARAPPAQLPIVLQVLLSQTHRLRALVLLARFLDVGTIKLNTICPCSSLIVATTQVVGQSI